VRKVEGRVRPVEAITENEELEAVGLGVEGSRRGDDGDDARFVTTVETPSLARKALGMSWRRRRRWRTMMTFILKIVAVTLFSVPVVSGCWCSGSMM
jgi:hypothetical protein